MATGGLLPSQILSTTGLGSDNNDFVPDFWTAPIGSGPNGSAVPALGTNRNDPTQVGDTGSTVAADDTSGFDVNSFFDSIFNNAFKAYQLAQSGQNTLSASQRVQLANAQLNAQLALAQSKTQASSSSSTVIILAIAAVVVVVLIVALGKGAR